MPLISIKRCLNCSSKTSDVPHEWLFEGATLRELRMIKDLTGMRAMEFAQAGDEGDPEALAALIYVLHKRSKIELNFEEVDLDFTDFEMKPTADEEKAIADLEAAAGKAAADAQAPKVTRSGRTGKAASTPR